MVKREWVSTLCVALAMGVPAVAAESRVKHLVILMMENHSFDNMLGEDYRVQLRSASRSNMVGIHPRLLVLD